MNLSRRLPKLVHFFGPDGAGKSTQVEILIKEIRKQELRVRKCWIRSPHTFAFLLWRLFLKIGFYRVACNPLGYEIRLPAVHFNKPLRLFWAVIEFFSVLPLLMRTRIHMSRGYTLVAERYILDTVTTVAFFIDDMTFLKGKIARLFLLFIPKDTVFIFLDSDFETIFKRRAHVFGGCYDKKTRGYGMIPESAVEPREFIEFQRTAYKALAKQFNAFTIDTSRSSIEETSNAILEYLQLSNRFF